LNNKKKEDGKAPKTDKAAKKDGNKK